MSGYNVSGIPLSVTSCPSERSKQFDARRNLYVLGLPSELTKNELISQFSHFGKVAHCVILATVDNASRRRAFVVMSTHEEARSAMEGISRTNINGQVIDVSWAVVQRSRGFLDGGDRAMVLEHRPEDAIATETPLNVFTPANTSSNALEACRFQPNLSLSTILVKNLPTLLFSSVSDLDPLLRPFGSVSSIDFMTDSTSDGTSNTAIVKFDSFEDAQEAKERLDGQVYAGLTLRLEHMSAMPSPATAQPRDLPLWAFPTRDNTPLASAKNKNLNPLAAPFVHEHPRGQLAAPGNHEAWSKPAFSSQLFNPFSPQLQYRQYSSSYVRPPQTTLCYDPPFDYALHGPVIPNKCVPTTSSRWNANTSASLPWESPAQQHFSKQADLGLYV
ncbi:hypothetical protein HWV62_37671 [Athelia sp. TMB]|nr:hypothetical protein HWV62_37671 [Athelia sp. TMB]